MSGASFYDKNLLYTLTPGRIAIWLAGAVRSVITGLGIATSNSARSETLSLCNPTDRNLLYTPQYGAYRPYMFEGMRNIPTERTGVWCALWLKGITVTGDESHTGLRHAAMDQGRP